MSKIYDLHSAAFAQVSAYIILKDGEKVATVAFKYPKDGAGRLWCYLHVVGLKMVRGYAGGYGYDKTSAAFDDAAKAQTKVEKAEHQREDVYKKLINESEYIYGCLEDSHDWTYCLQNAGYIVIKAV